MVSKSTSLRRLIPLFGAALIASLALGVSSAAAAPVNKTLPVVSPATPYLGSVESTTDGTWTGEGALTYTYSWQRCDASGGECATIAGAKASTYTAVIADQGHTLVAAVKATDLLGSTTAYSKPTNLYAPPAPHYWYSCAKSSGEGTKYSDSACTTESKTGAYVWKKVTSTGITMAGTAPFTWAGHIFGGDFAVNCSTQASSKGLASNSEKGIDGKGSATLTFSGCTVTKPTQAGTCTVSMPSTEYAIQLAEFQGTGAVKFTPSPYQTITLSGASCPLAYRNQSFNFSGSFTGISNPLTSSIEFTKAGSNLIAQAYAASVEGTSKIETSAKEALMSGL